MDATPPPPRPDEPGWTGPVWDDPMLTTLADRLLEAHRLVAPLPPDVRRRLIRQLLVITDLAKRDSALAVRRLAAFRAAFEAAQALERRPEAGGDASHGCRP